MTDSTSPSVQDSAKTRFRWNREMNRWEFFCAEWGGWCVLRTTPKDTSPRMTYEEGRIHLQQRGNLPYEVVGWENCARITVTDLQKYGIAIYDFGESSTERVLVQNHMEAERVVRALADRFGTGRFKVIRQRNSEGRFEA